MAKAMSTDVLIAGAGIVGLTLALTLARHGHQSTLLEAFEAPAEIGAGLQVPPNATRVLAALGVLDALQTRAMAPQAVCLGDALSGTILMSMDVRESTSPWLTAHRAHLHGVLHDAAVAEPLITLRTGVRVQSASQSADGVTVTAETVHGGHLHLDGICLIGADGMWSKTRAGVIGATAPQLTGRIAMRAVVPSLDDASENRVVAWMAPDSHLVTYPMRNAETRNLVAIIRAAGSSEGWDEKAEDDALSALGHALSRTAHADLVGHANWTRWTLAQVDPGSAWSDGRIGLIGDAAHGIEPFAAQGAAMAIEDGYVMGRLLADYPDNPIAAFAAFDTARRDRIRQVAKRTQFNRSIYHLSGPMRHARNLALRVRSGASFLSDLDWLYGFDVTR